MKSIKLATTIGLTVGSVLFVSNSAQAGTFTFDIEQKNGVKGDTFLKSITQNGEKINDFSYVDRADIIYNDAYTGGNTGAISTDRGIDVQIGATTIEGLEAQKNTNGMSDHERNIVDYLGNNNLNTIIDTEDNGAFTLNLFFDDLIEEDNKGLDSIFFFERGMNSNMFVQALDNNGNLIGEREFLKGKKKGGEEQLDTGFRIKTKEIGLHKNGTEKSGRGQQLGFLGVSLDDLEVDSLAGVQISAQLTDDYIEKEIKRRHNKIEANVEKRYAKIEANLEKKYADEEPEVREQKKSNALKNLREKLREDETKKVPKDLLHKHFQGPDFTVIARTSTSGSKFSQAAKVPEPGTIIGLGSVAALAFMRRRKSK